MVFAWRLLPLRRREGAARIEEEVVVTKEGGERIFKYPLKNLSPAAFRERWPIKDE